MIKAAVLPVFVFSFICILLLSCTVNKAKIDKSLQKHFDEQKVEGNFTMLNNADGEIIVSNMEMDTMRLLPASTFKIVNALIGLETGRITNTDMIIKWDGVNRRPEWNRDMSMKEAFKVRSVPYFQEVARRIGMDTMKHWIDTLSYGNKVMTGPIDTFWLNNTLKISPDEQLGLLKRLYFDQLPFRKSVQQMVREAMVQEDNTLYKLSYKTGWAMDEQNRDIGWVAGWIEENRHVYFFVTTIRSDNPVFDFKNGRVNITKNILKQLGFFEGKK